MTRTTVDRNGRVLLPAPMRRALGLRTGSELQVELDEAGRLVLVAVDDPWSRAQALFDDVDRGGSAVDELLAERRAEASREQA